MTIFETLMGLFQIGSLGVGVDKARIISFSG